MLSGQCHVYDCKETMEGGGGRTCTHTYTGFPPHAMQACDYIPIPPTRVPHAMQACDYIPIPPTPCHAGM